MLLGLFEFLDGLPEFMTTWWFIPLMIVALLALVGVMFFLRNRNTEE